MCSCGEALINECAVISDVMINKSGVGARWQPMTVSDAESGRTLQMVPAVPITKESMQGLGSSILDN